MGILEHLVSNQAVVLTDLNSYININTLFWVVAVLAVLLLIALVYLINIMSYLKNNSAVKAANINSSVNNSMVADEQGELVGNNELVAVITAAIYASMEGDVPADGLVVRSIRRARR